MPYYIDTEKIVWRIIDGEVIILHLDTGHYYGLNKTGSLIWNLIVQEKSPEEITHRMTEEYRVSKKTAQKDVAGMISLFEKELLISSQAQPARA